MHRGMSKDNSNLLLELLQNQSELFDLDDLGQSPRFQAGYLIVRGAMSPLDF